MSHLDVFLLQNVARSETASLRGELIRSRAENTDLQRHYDELAEVHDALVQDFINANHQSQAIATELDNARGKIEHMAQAMQTAMPLLLTAFHVIGSMNDHIQKWDVAGEGRVSSMPIEPHMAECFATLFEEMSQVVKVIGPDDLPDALKHIIEQRLRGEE